MTRIGRLSVVVSVVALVSPGAGVPAEELSFRDECPQSKAFIETAEAHLKDTPKLSYYDASKGLVVARSDAAAAPCSWLTFQVPVSSEKGVGPDAGHFTIFCGQYLVCDGEKINQIRPGGQVVRRNSREVGNYNTIILDGLAPWEAPDPGYRPGAIVALKDYPEGLYVAADLAGPWGGKAKTLTRQIVFLRPDILVVYDRVVASEKMSMSWCLNLMESPGVAGKVMTVTSRITGNGLYCLTLLPEDTVAMRPRLGERGGGVSSIPGWRMERQSRDLLSETNFLHVLYFGRVRPGEDDKPFPIDLLREASQEGARITRREAVAEILFSKTGPPSGRMTVKNKQGPTVREFAATVEAP